MWITFFERNELFFLGRKMGWVFPKTFGTSYISPTKSGKKKGASFFFVCLFLCHVGCEDCNSWCVGCRTSLILFVFMVKSSTALMTRATGVCHLTAKAIRIWSSEQTWKGDKRNVSCINRFSEFFGTACFVIFRKLSLICEEHWSTKI